MIGSTREVLCREKERQHLCVDGLSLWLVYIEWDC
jgi:hypothetical protein